MEPLLSATSLRSEGNSACFQDFRARNLKSSCLGSIFLFPRQKTSRNSKGKELKSRIF